MPASIKHLTDRRVIYNSLLARWKDGLYYTAVLTKCDRANKRCRVCFEDGSEIWVSNRDLHIQLTLDQLSEDEDIVCCICDDGNSEPPNEIILCDVCQQGYHQNCHLPPVDASKLDDSEETKDHKDWFCATCSFILNQTNRAKLSATVAAAQQQQQQQHERTTRANSSGPSASKQPRLEAKTPVSTSAQQASSSSSSSSSPQTKPKQPSSQQAMITTPSKTTTTVTTAATTAATTTTTATTTASPEKVGANKQVHVVKQPPKVKQTPSLHQQMGLPKSAVGAVRSDVGLHQRSAPYYPLSNQARAMATSSTAALASLTASSALVVGSSAGRTKQDLVKQSNRSTQRQIPTETSTATTTAAAATAASAPPDTAATTVPKHAVRKSSMNFSAASPVKQSALPTATRSSPAGVSIIGAAKNMPAQAARATVTARPVITMSIAPPVTAANTTVSPQSTNSSYSIMALTNQSKPGRVVVIDGGGGGGGGVNNLQTKEHQSVISVPGGSAAQQAASGAPASVIETEPTSDASSCVSQASSGATVNKSNSAREEQTSNISSSSSSGSNAAESQQRQQAASGSASAADSTRSAIESGNGTITNKPVTVIVGANID